MAPLSITVTSLLRKASILSLSLLLYGLGLSVGTAEAQPYGSNGWCNPMTGCEGSMNVSGPFGACPGNLVTCPVSGMGCMMGQSGNCCAQSSIQAPGLYSYVCESSGGNGGGGGGGGSSCNTVPLNLSASCNSAGTQATIDFGTPSGWGPRYDLRVDADPTSWTNTCARVNPGDVCTTVTTPNYTLNTVPGHTYAIWAHPWTECGGYWTESNIVQSVSLTCSPPPPPAPVPDLRINGSNGPLSVTSGTNLNLTWGAVANATSCTATAGAGWATVAKSTVGGNENVLAAVTSVYTLSCTGAGGTGTDSVSVTVNTPPPPPPPNPVLSYTCDPSGTSVRLSWNFVPTATLYPLSVNDTSNGWGPSETPPKACDFYSGDECYDTANLSYTRSVVPGRDYQSWIRACNAGGCSPGVGTTPFPFRCDLPMITVRGRITNQAGAGIPGVTISACASNPGAVTDASGNYSFTVPHDARFCIRPNTPAGMNSNPLLSGLQPSQQAIHTYEWQVAGWNAGVHPFCDNFDSVNRIPASCDEWKQWDRGVDTGYDFAYSPVPLATIDLKANNAADSLTIQNDRPVVLTWSTSNVVPGSCSASNAWNGAKADNNATGENRGNLATGIHTFTLTCRENISNILRSDMVSVTSIVPPCVCNNDAGVCKGEYYTGSGSSCVPNGCGPGTKDCRRFWREVAP